MVSTSPSRERASSSSTEDMEAVLLSDESCQYNQEELSQRQSYDLEDIDETSEVQRTFNPPEASSPSSDSIEDMEVHS